MTAGISGQLNTRKEPLGRGSHEEVSRLGGPLDIPVMISSVGLIGMERRTLWAAALQEPSL